MVEPNYHRRKLSTPKNGKVTDDTRWYPPLGLMKLSRFHKARGDEVLFACGIDKNLLLDPIKEPFDRVYITTLFTFDFDKVVETINYYRTLVGGTSGKIFVGGIMASLMPQDLFEKTGIYPILGVLKSPQDIQLPGDENIDELCPDYSLLDSSIYAINSTFYGYTTRGCTNTCPWCGVPRIEPDYVPYIDIKPVIKKLRDEVGDLPHLKLMDNNVLASPKLKKIVKDLILLGYERGATTNTQPKRTRTVDFNQGLDASFVTTETMELISQLNLRPMRLAFDRLSERKIYVNAVRLAQKYGISEFSNYMLYNFNDTPKDLYERLIINIKLNEEWYTGQGNKSLGTIYSYPMRFAPIFANNGNEQNKRRDPEYKNQEACTRNWLLNPVWTPRFVRNIEIMKGAVHGAISPTPGLAWRTVGRTFEEFLGNLYMPEELLRNRNKHEKTKYSDEPKRKKGSGKVEEFRTFVLDLLSKQDERFILFHNAVIPNRTDVVRRTLDSTKDRLLHKWLKLYIRSTK